MNLSSTHFDLSSEDKIEQNNWQTILNKTKKHTKQEKKFPQDERSKLLLFIPWSIKLCVLMSI